MNIYEYDKRRWEGNIACVQYRLIKSKRRCEKYTNNRIAYPIVWFLYHKLQIKYGLDIPAKTKIGSGFKIEHPNGIVINPDVVIGKIAISTMELL